MCDKNENLHFYICLNDNNEYLLYSFVLCSDREKIELGRTDKFMGTIMDKYYK